MTWKKCWEKQISLWEIQRLRYKWLLLNNISSWSSEFLSNDKTLVVDWWYRNCDVVLGKTTLDFNIFFNYTASLKSGGGGDGCDWENSDFFFGKNLISTSAPFHKPYNKTGRGNTCLQTFNFSLSSKAINSCRHWSNHTRHRQFLKPNL